MSEIDWSDVSQLEFCKGSGWGEGHAIVGAFLREDGILVVVRRPSGLHVHFVVDAEGRIYDGTRVIRNKPKTVKLEISSVERRQGPHREAHPRRGKGDRMRDAILTLLFCAALFCVLAAYQVDGFDWWYLAVGLWGTGRALLPKHEREM